MTDGCNHLSTMKNGSRRETERRDKNITVQKANGNVSSCHPKVVHERCPCREPSQSPPVRNDRRGDKTNYVDGDGLTGRGGKWTGMTDTWETAVWWCLGRWECSRFAEPDTWLLVVDVVHCRACGDDSPSWTDRMQSQCTGHLPVTNQHQYSAWTGITGLMKAKPCLELFPLARGQRSAA